MKLDHDQTHFVDEQARILSIARIVTVYVLTVVAVVWGTVYYKIALFTSNFLAWPTGWMLMIWSLYYLVPPVLAVIYGLLFRPFWPSFRNLLVTILAIQLLYSFGASMLRWDYSQKIHHNARWSKNDRIKIINFDAKYLDKDQDGFKDELDVHAVFDLAKVRPGEYLLDAALVHPAGQPRLGGQVSVQGGETVKVVARGDQNLFLEQFVVAPPYGLARPGDKDVNFQIKFLLNRIVSVGDYGRGLLQFTRWVPFFRVTDWEGRDRDIIGNWTVLDTLTEPEIFTLRAGTGK